MAKMSKKSVSEDLATTFSSPAAWFLVVALIVTWSAVAIVMFDLLDYKSLVADIDPAYSLYCDEPCVPPGKQQAGVGKVLKEAQSPRGGFKELSSDPVKVIDEAVEDTSNWINGFISLLSDTLSTTDDDMDEGEIKPQTKKKAVLHPPAKRKGEAHPPSKRKAPPPETKRLKLEKKIKIKEVRQKAPLKVDKKVKVSKVKVSKVEEKVKKQLKVTKVKKREEKVKKPEKKTKDEIKMKPKIEVKKEHVKPKIEKEQRGKKREQKEPSVRKSEKTSKKEVKVKVIKEVKQKSKDKGEKTNIRKKNVRDKNQSKASERHQKEKYGA